MRGVIVEEIHKRIKELRLAKGFTLKEMSEVTNLSLSFLSQVERGDSSLSITSLKKISDALEVSIVSFFEENLIDPHYKVSIDKQKPFKIKGGEQSYIRLSGSFTDRKLEPVIVTLPPKMKEDIQYSHLGEEFYYVLEGSVRFFLEESYYLVEEGETIHFPSKIPHSWDNPNDFESVILSVTTPIIF